MKRGNFDDPRHLLMNPTLREQFYQWEKPPNEE